MLFFLHIFEFDINVYEKQVYNNLMGRSIHILHICGQKIIDIKIYTLKTHSKQDTSYYKDNGKISAADLSSLES